MIALLMIATGRLEISVARKPMRRQNLRRVRLSKAALCHPMKRYQLPPAVVTIYQQEEMKKKEK